MSQQQGYREVKAINKSSMDIYEDDYQTFVNWWVNNQPIPSRGEEFFSLGSAIDVLITRPQDYENEFAIFRGVAPTAQMMAFCNALADFSASSDAPLPVGTFYQQAYDKVGIKASKLETIVSKFEGQFLPYYTFLTTSGDKTVLSIEQASKAGRIVQELRENRFTAPIVNAENTDNYEVHNQVEIYSSYKGIPIKGALDRVLISHKKKIIQPIDFKSSSDIFNFERSYSKYRYFRQGSFYSHLLKSWVEGSNYADYTILPFMFVVCSTTGGQHWMYRMHEDDVAGARFGGDTQGYKIKGWQEILDEIVYMTEKGEWAFPYEAQINNGIIELNIFK